MSWYPAVVRDGWVTLAGNVDWYFQMQSAEGDIRKLSSVRGVKNNINIKPRVRAVDVKKQIEGALRRRLEGEVKGIRITAEDGNKILLEGFVESWNERNAVEIAAWSAPGVSRRRPLVCRYLKRPGRNRKGAVAER